MSETNYRVPGSRLAKPKSEGSETIHFFPAAKPVKPKTEEQLQRQRALAREAARRTRTRLREAELSVQTVVVPTYVFGPLLVAMGMPFLPAAGASKRKSARSADAPAGLGGCSEAKGGGRSPPGDTA